MIKKYLKISFSRKEAGKERKKMLLNAQKNNIFKEHTKTTIKIFTFFPIFDDI